MRQALATAFWFAVGSCVLVATSAGEVSAQQGNDGAVLDRSAAVAQSLLNAATTDDEATFTALKEASARMFWSNAGEVPPEFEPLTIANVRAAFVGCELGPVQGIDEHMAFVQTKCGRNLESKNSFFLIYDGKVRIFYKFMQPLVVRVN